MTASEDGTVAVTLPPHGGEGLLGMPATATATSEGVVLFAHGSGSSRLSPRNIFVARALQQAGLATLRFDLLTRQEAMHRVNVFDIALLAHRLDAAATWLRDTAATQHRPLGLFGASTGAAAGLLAAASRRDVGAVVSRGGRPDLAGDAPTQVTAPTLLIVGEQDAEVMALNRAAARRLSRPHRLEVVADATPPFEEPGMLDMVVAAARDWFVRHLTVRAVETGHAVH